MDELTLHPAHVHKVGAIQDVASRGDEDGSVPEISIDLVAGGIIAGPPLGEETGNLQLDRLLREEDVDCVATVLEGFEGEIAEDRHRHMVPEAINLGRDGDDRQVPSESLECGLGCRDRVVDRVVDGIVFLVLNRRPVAAVAPAVYGFLCCLCRIRVVRSTNY